MLKIKNIILLLMYTVSVAAPQKNEQQCNNKKKEQGSYNTRTKSISSTSSSITTNSLYNPSLFSNNSIFSGDSNIDDDDSDDEKNKLYKTKERYYNLIPDSTKDIDVIILLVERLIAFLSSADMDFHEGYNEFIERLYLIVEFLKSSVTEKYSKTIMLHLSNRAMYNFQVFLYSEDSLAIKDLSIQQKQKIIDALPKKLNYASNSEEYYEYMKSLKNFLQKLIVDFIWINDLSIRDGGEIVVDTEKIIENAKLSSITSIQDLKDNINSNRSFFKKNKNIQLGLLRKDSQKYKNKFLQSNIVHQINLIKVERHDKPVDFLADIFRKTINKRLIEQKPKLKELPDSALDIINIIAKGFNFQKIILFLEKIKYDNLNKFLVELNKTTSIELNNTQITDKTVVFLQLDIKEVLQTTILEQIKLRLSRQILSEIIIDILGEEVNEVIYQIKVFLHKKIQNNEDTLSLASTSSSNSIKESDEDYLVFEANLVHNLERFLYSIACKQLSNDRILFFLELMDIANLYLLADKVDIKYQELIDCESSLQNKKKILFKIVSNTDNFKNIAVMLIKTLSENEKFKINNYFNDLCDF